MNFSFNTSGQANSFTACQTHDAPGQTPALLASGNNIGVRDIPMMELRPKIAYLRSDLSLSRLLLALR